MTDRPETTEDAQREAEAALKAAHSQTFAQSALVQAAKRTGDHFAGRNASDPPDDAAELWGRRIGRALSLLGVIGLAIYLFVTYILR